jgi:hypothetical protein
MRQYVVTHRMKGILVDMVSGVQECCFTRDIAFFGREDGAGPETGEDGVMVFVSERQAREHVISQWLNLPDRKNLAVAGVEVARGATHASVEELCAAGLGHLLGHFTPGGTAAPAPAR